MKAFVSLNLVFLAGLFLTSPVLADDIEIDLGGNSSKTAPSPTPAKAAEEKPKVEKGEKSTPKEPEAKTEDVASSLVNKIELSSTENGTALNIRGNSLPEPTVEKLSSQKILMKFASTKLKVPKQIKEKKGPVTGIRSSLHGTTAWVVVDGKKLSEFNLEKIGDGYSLVFGDGSSTFKKDEAKAPAPSKGSAAMEKSLFLRLIDASLRPMNTGLKLVLTSDGPSKYTIRKLSQPEKLVIHLQDTKIEVTEKLKKFKNGDVELQKGGLLSMELRQIGQSYSPISEILLTVMPGTIYQVDRDLNQVVITLSAAPVVQKPEDKKGNMNQLISMDIESADINAVLKTLVGEAGFEVNFVGGPLTGIVTQKFKNIPFKTALADLLAPGNYDYDLQGNTLRIGPQASLKSTKAILPHVTELISASGGMTPSSLDTMVRSILPASNAVTSIMDTTRNVIVLNGTSSDIEGYKKAIRDLKLDSDASGDRITRVVKLNYADANTLTNILTPYLTPVGKVQISGQRLVIWESASNMGVLLELIKELDTKPAQVLIESNIVEVDDENDLAIGVSWFANKANGDPTLSGGVNALPTSGAAGILQFGTVKSGLNISATLEALVTKKKGKVISRPRVATQSGVSAAIQEIENVVIQTVTQNPVAGAGIQTVTTFTQLGLPINLTVLPRITDDGRITTEILASITSQSGAAPPNGPPPTNVQTATTKLTTKNGETIVIGGLVREVVTDVVSGVPLLSSIPILGTLFQDHEKVNRKQELIIFITPTLLED